MQPAVEGTPRTDAGSGLTVQCLRIGKVLSGAIANLREVTGLAESPSESEEVPPGSLGLLRQQVNSLQELAESISFLVSDLQQRL